MGVSPTLNSPQASFLAMPHKFRAYVAGFGAGKTWAGSASLCKHAWEHPRVNAGYFAPTYPQIRDIFFPTIDEVAHDWGLRVSIAEANKEVSFYSGRKYRNTVICRSMEKPASIVGFKIGRALVDEIDVLPKAKAEQAWRKIIARLRTKYDGLNGIDVTTTPEGFKFTYLQWVKALRDSPELSGMYGLIQASTYDNELYLPSDYIPSLIATYPPQLIAAYLDGQFVNLTSGTVYNQFDRTANASSETLQPAEPVFVGMDFNVGKMAAVIHVKREGKPHAVAEIVDAYDTPDMIGRLNTLLGARQIRVYPDASGDSRKSVNASTTDIALLKQAGFTVIVNASNPPVKDRINAMNACFSRRDYKVNPNTCPTYTDHLEQQVWTESGEPDKSAGCDHTNDAAGYFIAKEYPIVRPVHNLKLGFARG